MARVNYDDYLKQSRKIPSLSPDTTKFKAERTARDVLEKSAKGALDYKDSATSYLDEYNAREGSNYVETPDVAQPTTPLTPTQDDNKMNDYLKHYEESENNNYVDTTKPSTPTTPVSGDGGGSATPKNNMWDIYKSQLAQSSVNQKAELDAINQRANSYVNAYLKSLGLSGTSAGASQIAENGMNLANAYSQVNANEQTALNAQRETNSDNLMGIYQAAVESGASNRTLNEILDSYDDDSVTTGTKDLLNNYAKAMGNTWESDKQLTQDDMLTQLTENASSLNENQLKQVNDILTQLKGAKTQEEYNDIYDKNQDVIQDITNASTSYSTVEQPATENTTKVEGQTSPNNSSVTSNNYNGKYQSLSDKNQAKLDEAIKDSNKTFSAQSVKETDFGDYSGTGKKGDTQYIWTNVLMDLAKKGELPNNTAINMNVGVNWDNDSGFVYKNGNWYKIGAFSKSPGDADGGFAHAEDSIQSIKSKLREITNKNWDDLVDEYSKK